MFSNKWELMENKEKEIHKERDGERREVLVLIQFQKILSVVAVSREMLLFSQPFYIVVVARSHKMAPS